MVCLALSVLMFTGCETVPSDAASPTPVGEAPSTAEMALNPGDLITISFSGVPSPPDRYEGTHQGGWSYQPCIHY